MTPSYAWCFDHGRLHHFTNGAWCTAAWTPLAGTTKAQAMADKTTRYGDAIYIDQLPLEQQVKLVNERQARP